MAFGSAVIGDADMPSSIANVATRILCTVTLPRPMSLRGAKRPDLIREAISVTRVRANFDRDCFPDQVGTAALLTLSRCELSRHSRASGNPGRRCAISKDWVPACAGMTKVPLMRCNTTSVSSRAGRPQPVLARNDITHTAPAITITDASTSRASRRSGSVRPSVNQAWTGSRRPRASAGLPWRNQRRARPIHDCSSNSFDD